MQSPQRIITEFPLRELWDDSGTLPAIWARDLSAAQVRELLRKGPVRFIVAEVGAKPEWVEMADCFAFWKREVQQHLAEPEQRVLLEEFPGSYCYFASEWSGVGSSPIVILQQYH